MAGFGTKVADFFRGTLLSGGAQPPQNDYEDYDDDDDDYNYSRSDRYEARYDARDYDEDFDRDRKQSHRQEPQQSYQFARASSSSASRTTTSRSASSNKVIDMYSSGRDRHVAETISVKPTDMSEVVSLVEQVANGRMLIVDITKATPENSQRIADYMSGACQMAGGKIMRVNNGIFTIAPKNHSVTADYFDEIDTDVQFFSSAAR